MQIVNLRHPGYDDSCNIILVLQAPDDPNGGIHAETARLACCVLAGNDWTGYLSITQHNPTPVITEDGILRRKDYYFHLLNTGSAVDEDSIVDLRKDPSGPYPITARFVDWSFPEHGLPPIWQLTGEIIQRTERQPVLDEDGDPLSETGCRLCGRDEPTEMAWLWDWDNRFERNVFEREKSKVQIAAELGSDYRDSENEGSEDAAGSDDSDDSDDPEDPEDSGDSKGSENSKDIEALENSEDFGTFGDAKNTGDAEDADTEQPDEADDDQIDDPDEENLEAPGGDANDNSHGLKKTSEPLFDNRNILRIATNCSAESLHCTSREGFVDHQWLFVPKGEETGEPTLRAHIFSAKEDGIEQAHGNPLLFPWKSSVELLFVHFVQATFAQLSTFFEKEVQRTVRIVDADARVLLIDTDPAMCKSLILPDSKNMWPAEDSDAEPDVEPESDDDSVNEDNDASSRHGSPAPQLLDKDAENDESGQKQGSKDDNDELAETKISPEAFRALMEELAEDLKEPEQIPETVKKTVFPDLPCAGCQQPLLEACFRCLDCDDFDFCSECIETREQSHAGHRFLPLYDSPWLTEVPTGNMISKKSDAAQSSNSGSTGNAEEQEAGLEGRLALHIPHDHVPVVSLEDAPPFEALSYFWGDPKVPRRIVNISGHKIEVTENLKLALYRLRHPENTRRLWIDGICINQGDDVEKSAQVQMMRAVYERAQQTVVWLGEEDDDSSTAFHLCNRLVDAHGNTYVRQTYGVDVENMFKQKAGDNKNQSDSTLEQTISDFVASFDFDQALEGAQDDQYAEVTAAMLADEEDLDVEHLGYVAGYHFVSGKKYEGPHKEVVFQFMEVSRKKMEAEGSMETDNTEQERVPGEEVDGHDRLEMPATTYGPSAPTSLDEDVVDTEPIHDATRNGRDISTLERHDQLPVDPPSKSTFYQRFMLQILQARQRKDSAAAKREPPTWHEIKALFSICDRDWFRRVWVIQEAGVSSQVLIQCGGQTIDWWTFIFGFTIAQNYQRGARLGPGHHQHTTLLSSTRASFHKFANGTPGHMFLNLGLTELLLTYRNFSSTDARDKIFALFGITKTDLTKLGLVVDYTKSTPEVYIEVAKALLEGSRHLDILSIPQGKGMLAAELPSWVPDWSDSSRMPCLLSTFHGSMRSDMIERGRRTFFATDNSEFQAQADSRELHLQGYMFDEIVECGSPLRIDPAELTMHAQMSDVDLADLGTFLDILRRFFAVLATLSSVVDEWKALAEVDDEATTYPTGQTKFEAFAATLWTGDKDALGNYTPWIAMLKRYNAIANELPAADADDDMLSWIAKALPVMNKLNPGIIQKGVAAIKCVHIYDRRFAKTARGYFCLLPAETEVGDDVALLKGGKTPFVLRNGNMGTRLVGESYVHGIMYGGGWDEEECEEVVLV
ncbi:hypothetical protein PRZ48_014800 [Zasmidium cellare]|uniref:ZZ-type domain-containing protein n=1 Tax=Zasmidium cellare TaxID=395010 RepID=A0ABR0DZA0_ZASCE|nr:hypothetical protein PRZ48_014800 [Zasmidium cellare]